MTIPIEMPILLIDGNNLAHFLYTNLVPGQKMTQADSQRLIDHLASYARTYAGQAIVELCLDRSPGGFDPTPENMRVFWAEYPQTGDDLLLGRFWFHHMANWPCLVISNDETLLEEVREAQGNAFRVSDFVRRPGLDTPVLRDPQDLPSLTGPAAQPPAGEQAGAKAGVKTPSLSASIYFRIVEDNRQEKKKENGARPTVLPGPSAFRPSTRKPKPETDPEPQLEPKPVANVEEPSPTARIQAQPEDPGESTYYFLSLETWPLAEGVRFLRNAFCGKHRGQYLDLLQAFDPQTLTPADLRALAELLLHTCGDEPDFAQRGSLMARVRLALLQARGEPLLLPQIAEATGLKQTGLQGRIKEKAEKWVVMILA